MNELYLLAFHGPVVAVLAAGMAVAWWRRDTRVLSLVLALLALRLGGTAFWSVHQQLDMLAYVVGFGSLAGEAGLLGGLAWLAARGGEPRA